ncbi:MAG: GNAT family N-acetyltransferase [Pseudomonadota bacterium]
MTGAGRYEFRQATSADLALLNAWQLLPHVREWWDVEDLIDEEDLSDPRVLQWVVSFSARPFAFMQDYTVHGWDDHHFAGLPKGSRGIDQFIGPTEMVGIGHGTAFIGKRIRALFEVGAPAVATDPHPDNARAIAAYRKLGFRTVGPPRETEWGLILPMLVEP